MPASGITSAMNVTETEKRTTGTRTQTKNMNIMDNKVHPNGY